MDYKQVEGRSDLFRDTDSGAIVNTDRSAFLAYKAKKQQRLNEMGRIEKLQNEVDEIKSPVSYTHLTLPTSDLV